MRIGANGSANLKKFGHIQASLTHLELRDERLPLADSQCHVGLGQTGVPSGLNERGDKPLIKVALRRSQGVSASI